MHSWDALDPVVLSFRCSDLMGRVGFSITSHLNENTITAKVDLPASFAAVTKLRLRTPRNAKVKSVTLNGKSWFDFDPADETITIPAGTFGTVILVASF